MSEMPQSRLADACPECAEWVEPVVVMPADGSRGADCLYACGCHAGLWAAVVAYPAGDIWRSSDAA
jgi:hypothetical protein